MIREALVHFIKEDLDDPEEGEFTPEELEAISIEKTFYRVLMEQIMASLYGQSWTTTEESDALWRIYSPDRRGIRLEVDHDSVKMSIDEALKDVNIDIDFIKWMSDQQSDELEANGIQTDRVAVHDAIDDLFSSIKCYGFEVKYLSKEDSLNDMKERWGDKDELYEEAIAATLYKRKEFAHENEYRFCGFINPTLGRIFQLGDAI